MGRSATRIVASILAALLAGSCGTVKEAARPNAVGRVFIPRAARLVASPVVEELELRRALEELLPAVDVETVRADLRRLVVDPRFHGRSPEKFRVVLASWGSGPVALEEIGRGYRAHCAAEHRTNCLEGPLTDSSVYKIAFDFAMGSQWDGFVGEVKSTIDPSTIRIVLLTGLVIFMATIAIPELASKIPAAAATMVLTAYLGARAVCDLVFGWIQMVRELDAATTFNEVRAAGQRYGRLVGAQTARVLILLATAAIAQGGLIARLMKLPRATQASAALATETGGVALEAVGSVKEVRVLESGVAIIVEGAAKGAVGVAMAAHGGQGTGEPRTSQSSSSSSRPPRRREGLTEPSGQPDPTAQPGGRRTQIPAEADEATARSLRLENQAADELAQAGYKVEQNPTVPGLKSPDLVVEGEIFDVYSPAYGTSTKNIFNAVRDKVLAGQTGRVVINLGESNASVPQLMREFTQRRGDVRQLSEVLVVRKGTVTRIYP